jgi:rRNA pseudouridine-1189 N-methylase Emg1 (Nep1/Mra1 family)
LSEIYPNETTTDALTKLYDEWREGEADFVESQLQSMITSKLNYQKEIRTVIQTLEQSEELETR